MNSMQNDKAYLSSNRRLDFKRKKKRERAKKHFNEKNRTKLKMLQTTNGSETNIHAERCLTIFAFKLLA